MSEKKLVVISDVDGVLTDGSFFYDANGKCMKRFGRDDADALKMMRDVLPSSKMIFCSSDKRGFPITSKRLDDMHVEYEFKSVKERLQWIKSMMSEEPDAMYVYVGDSFVDVPILSDPLIYSCVPKNAHHLAKAEANYVASYDGGNGGFADCLIHVMSQFTKLSPEALIHRYIGG